MPVLGQYEERHAGGVEHPPRYEPRKGGQGHIGGEGVPGKDHGPTHHQVEDEFPCEVRHLNGDVRRTADKLQMCPNQSTESRYGRLYLGRKASFLNYRNILPDCRTFLGR